VDAHRVQVLVTGSLHLVGGVIACIQEDGIPPRREVDAELVARYRELELEVDRPTGSVHSNRHNCVPGML